MYDLVDIIETKLNGMDHLIRKWMTNHNLIKSSLINDIKTIKNTINSYHNKYVVCDYYQKYGTCKYGKYCWYLHPTSIDNNNSSNNNTNNSSNNNNNSEEKISFENEYNYGSDSDDNDPSIITDDLNNNNIQTKEKKKKKTKRKRKRKKYRKVKDKQNKEEKINNELQQTKHFFAKDRCKDTHTENKLQKNEKAKNQNNKNNNNDDDKYFDPSENKQVANQIFEDHKHLLYKMNITITVDQLKEFPSLVWFNWHNWFYGYYHPNDSFFKRKNNLNHFAQNFDKYVGGESLESWVERYEYLDKDLSIIFINKLFEINKQFNFTQ